MEKHPEIAAKLGAELSTWNSSLCPPDPGSPQEYAFYHRYFSHLMPGKQHYQP